jgi:Peptidase family C25
MDSHTYQPVLFGSTRTILATGRSWLVWFCLCLAVHSQTGSCFADIVVVRPKGWQQSLTSWLNYRRAQGHEIVQLDAELGGAELKQAISDLKKRTKLRFVMLAADVSSGVPTFYHPSTALVQFGGPATLATDVDYVDFDENGSPEVAIGRIPAKSPAELESYLDRVMAYECDQDYSAWRRDVHVVAGVGGFGATADSVIELTTRRFLSESLPNWVNLSMTQASLSSHFCPDPINFGQTSLARLNQGGLFWVYIGHGWVDQLDSIRVGDSQYPIMSLEHVPAVDVQHPPIALFLACYTGAFDARQECLAARLILNDSGPIAAVAATRVSGPYGLAILSDGLLKGYFEQRIETLGELLLQAKLASLQDERFASPEANSQLTMINHIATAMVPQGYDLKAERQEHVWQVNLLGDPAMRLPHARNLELDLESQQSIIGQSIVIAGLCPHAGNLTVELSSRRGVPNDKVRKATVDWRTLEGRQGYQDRYSAANQQTIVQLSKAVQAGTTTIRLDVPDNLRPGKYLIRQYLECSEGCYVGCDEVQLIRPSAPD